MRLVKRVNTISVFFFDPSHVGARFDDTSRPVIRPMVRFENSGLRQTLAKIQSLPLEVGPIEVALAESLAVVAALEIYRLNSSRPMVETLGQGQLTALQQRIIGDLIADPDADISLAGLASRVGLSRFHFARIFKKTYGLPPHRYITNQRIEIAKRMLAVDGNAIGELAASLGFMNYNSFCVAFRKATGVTPQQFRRARGG